jgi:uncharacterized membrane protein
MDDVTISRALHVISVVLCVGFVTTVLLPAVRRLERPNVRMEFLDRIEQRFAWQARIWTAIAGLTGFYMLYRMDAWGRFLHGAYWWMHAMVAVWLVFTLMLFVTEPLVLHDWLLARPRVNPEATFKIIEWLHRVLLLLSLITVFGAVAGSHGLLFE